MTVTMTATPAPATASVQLRLSGAGTVTRLERADANGTTSVRTLPGVLPWTYAGSDLIIDDYEPAAGAVNYWAETSNGTVPVSLTFELYSPWLFVPLQPAYSAELVSITAYGATRPGRSSVLEALGRRDPVVITRPMGSRRGNLSAFAGATYAAAAELLAACDRGEVLMLRQPEHAGLDMYFICESARIEPLVVEGSKTLWGVALDYLEVSRPASDIAGALGWTFAELAASAPSFATITRRYATFEDLRLDNRA